METEALDTLRIAIADEQELLREGIAQLLGERGFVVVAQTGDADELIAKVSAQRPDVALIDIDLDPDRDRDGLRAAMTIRADTPEVGVLLLSAAVTPTGALELIDGDSRRVGYLHKTRAGDTGALTGALRRLDHGGTAVDADVAKAVIAAAVRDGRISRVSPRERAVLTLIIEGRSDEEIGQALRISIPAVERHIERAHSALELEPELDPGLRSGVLIDFLTQERRRERPPTRSGVGAVLNHE